MFVNSPFLSYSAGNMLTEALNVRVAYQSENSKKRYFINCSYGPKLPIILLQVTYLSRYNPEWKTISNDTLYNFDDGCVTFVNQIINTFKKMIAAIRFKFQYEKGTKNKCQFHRY